MKLFKKGISYILLSLMLCISGCGNSDVVVDDYGSVNDSSQDTASGESDESKTGNDGKDSSSLVEANSGKSISDMLGGSTLDYSHNFDLGDKSASLDVVYNVTNNSELSVYKIHNLTDSSIKEADVVKNLLGDSAESLNSDSRKYLNESLDDSVPVINANQWVSYVNGGNYNIMGNSCPTWVDEGTYFIHNYEGTYHDITYQLLFSYSQNYNQYVMAFYPKNICDLSGNEDLKYFDFSGPDGMFYLYNYADGLKSYNINEIMADRPNPCNISDDDLMKTVKDELSNTLYMNITDDALSFNENLHDAVLADTSNLNKNEIIFYSDASFDGVNLDGATRNGYMCSVMYRICGLKVRSNIDRLDENAEALQTGYIGINDSGMIGFNITAQYSFDEKTAEHVNLLSFNEAMDSFINVVPENLDMSKLEKTKGTIKFDKIDLVYYSIPTENPGEYYMVPAWNITAEDSNYQTAASVYINAMDGSYINAVYPE